MGAQKRSCADCVLMLNVSDHRSARSIGGPVCGAMKGPLFIPLALTAEEGRVILEKKATGCESYRAEAEPGEKDSTRLRTGDLITGYQAMLPDPKSMEEYSSESGSVHADRYASCTFCKNFIPAEVMVENGLWNVGGCAARGILISSEPSDDSSGHRSSGSTRMARDCEKFSFGSQDPFSVQRMTVFPEYTFTTIGKLSGMESVTGFAQENIVEPSEYETDAPVTESESNDGIRAWRKIQDPNSKNSIMLPTFDYNFFDEDERAAIPKTGDDEHPEEYIDHLGLVYKTAVLWMALDETPALWGQAGTGKTEFFRHLAWLMGLPFHRISVTNSTEVDDLAGKMHYDPTRGTYFEYGRIPRAWQMPGVICLDEPNVGPPEVWQFIRPLTDNSKQLVLDMNKGERIQRHSFAFLGLAMNPSWDVRNSGTDTLADADGSRLMHVFVDLPNVETEKRIITRRVSLDGWTLEEDQIRFIIGIAKDLRRLSAEGTIPVTWGIRPQIKVARALKWFAPVDAYRLATADYLEPVHQEIILDIVRSHVSTRPPTIKGSGVF